MNRAANLSINDIKNIISSDEIKIISFDIFDTLLVRPSVKPKDIFYLLNGFLCYNRADMGFHWRK